MEIKNNSDFINKLIIKNNDVEYTLYDEPETFLINSSIYATVLKCLTRLEIAVLQYLGSYQLRVGEYTFAMEMVVLGNKFFENPCFDSSLKADFNECLAEMTRFSQFMHFWEEKVTLFQEVDNYSELEEFIATKHLEKDVISVKQTETHGITSLGINIKIVTFDGLRFSYDVIRDYWDFLHKKTLTKKQNKITNYNKPIYYYVTRALPWHRPILLDIYRIPLKNQRIFLELQTFLTCMRELTYAREPHLDLISLCSLKLAFCDDRNLTEASFDLKFEIDALIERHLRRMQRNQTYIKNGTFDIKQYAVDTNSIYYTSYPAVANFIYSFQEFFHSTNLYEYYSEIKRHIPELVHMLMLIDEKEALGVVKKRTRHIPYSEFVETLMLTDEEFAPEVLANRRRLIPELKQTLMFIDEEKALEVLTEKSNIPFYVDAENYNKMNSKLCAELLNSLHVDRIRISTNYKWINQPYFTKFHHIDFRKNTIELVGTNEFDFIEDFIQFLRTIPNSVTSGILLKIKVVTLKNYNIFKNLRINELMFFGSTITLTMLTGLSDCRFNLKFRSCTIEDQTSTWSLLIKNFDRTSVHVNILEGEKTWQHLFESIVNKIQKKGKKSAKRKKREKGNNRLDLVIKLNEFRFQCRLMIRAMNSDKWVAISPIVFIFDELNMRLNMRRYGKPTDLYYLRNFGTDNEAEDDYEDFEFYQ